MKHKIVLILGFFLLITVVKPLEPAQRGSSSLMSHFGRQISKTNDANSLGSIAHVRQIQLIAEKYGNRVALSRIIDDVEKYGRQIDTNTYEDNLRLYKMVCHFISKTGYVDMKTHYFRNKLNHAPKTLNELLLQNAMLPDYRRWKLMPAERSLYHMQGPDGVYNLKFISTDGFCEAVYNKSGILLTEKNDPVNMGTFNYAAGISQNNAHEKYDISPYLKWGNAINSPQKGRAAIQRGINGAVTLYNQNIYDIMIYRKKATSAMLRLA